ncbi:MAG: hypothetical protein D6762_04705 [Candidatus Neomarinimicrobiota bacterium]|nr:MAG: hypothetical protein D6762_04705 [Candidatus Neomarinimicrobiota bacterium]
MRRCSSFTLLIGLVTVLHGQAAPPDTTQNPLLQLIRDFGEIGFHWGEGYWQDILFHRREFYEPVSIIPLELSYGLFSNAGGGRTGKNLRSDYITYETAVEPYQGGAWTTRLGHQLELDLLKTNLSQYLFHTSWLDLHTGLNFRYTTLFAAPTIPASWGAGSKHLNPRVLELGLSNSFQLQWFDRWFLTGRYTYGRAFAKLYQTGKNMDPTPSGSGPAVSYAFGFRFILDPGLTNRFTVGVDIKHGFTKLTSISDPQNLTPIAGMHIASYGLFVTLSAFYGGKATIGEAAKDYFYHKDYVTAREKFREFLAAHPDHANVKRAQWYIDQCNRLIPEQLTKEGLSFDDRGLTDQALTKYLQARALTSDSVLAASLDERLRQIGAARVVQAQQLAFDHQFEEALTLMQSTAQFYPPAREQLPAFRARVTLERAKFALNHGLYRQAIELMEQAVTQDTTLEPEAELVRYDIAVALVKQADAIRDPDALQLVITSLETARELTGTLGKRNEAILEELKQRLAWLEAQRIQANINARMEAERAEKLKRNRERLTIGMTIPQVQDLLGEPADIHHELTEKGEDAQLWFYPLKDGRTLQLSFLEFRLFRIEKVKPVPGEPSGRP